jgi:hypothetical protein
MPVNAQVGSHAEEIVHFGAVRLRVTGVGNLDMEFLSLDSVDTQTLAPLAMQTTTGREPVRLANFISQRGMLKLSTNAISESFRINRIILFVKPIWSEYPG